MQLLRWLMLSPIAYYFAAITLLGSPAHVSDFLICATIDNVRTNHFRLRVAGWMAVVLVGNGAKFAAFSLPSATVNTSARRALVLSVVDMLLFCGVAFTVSAFDPSGGGWTWRLDLHTALATLYITLGVLEPVLYRGLQCTWMQFVAAATLGLSFGIVYFWLGQDQAHWQSPWGKLAVALELAVAAFPWLQHSNSPIPLELACAA